MWHRGQGEHRLNEDFAFLQNIVGTEHSARITHAYLLDPAHRLEGTTQKFGALPSPKQLIQCDDKRERLLVSWQDDVQGIYSLVITISTTKCSE